LFFSALTADKAMKRPDKHGNEGRQMLGMLPGSLLVILLRNAATYLIKSFVARG
jgi:hypothetical protein